MISNISGCWLAKDFNYILLAFIPAPVFLSSPFFPVVNK
jgi:hypothetical protein